MSHESRFGFSGNAESRILPPIKRTNQMLFVADGRQSKRRPSVSGRELGKGGSTLELSELKPGDVITFADINELTEFEDVIAAEVDPYHDRVLWAGRPKFRDLLRPKFKNGGAFNGRITNIQLIVMADPYERLLDAKDRGWKGRQKDRLGERHRLSSQLAESLIPRYRGFTLIADPMSSRPGELGQIQAELWYFPVPPVIKIAGSVSAQPETLKSGEKRVYTSISRKDYLKNPASEVGKALNRVVTQPVVEEKKFIELDANSRKIGFDVLRRAMSRPLSTTMRN